MKADDLFLAIGAVEESRLARSEMYVSSDDKQEDKNMKVKPTRIIRNLLVAAVIISMLAVTAYAVTGFLIFDGPEEMVSAIFGDQTGFDHNQGSIRPDPDGPPTGIVVEPTYDRVPADEAIVAEDVAPYVDPVGQSISWEGYTLDRVYRGVTYHITVDNSAAAQKGVASLTVDGVAVPGCVIPAEMVAGKSEVAVVVKMG